MKLAIQWRPVSPEFQEEKGGVVQGPDDTKQAEGHGPQACPGAPSRPARPAPGDAVAGLRPVGHVRPSAPLPLFPRRSRAVLAQPSGARELPPHSVPSPPLGGPGARPGSRLCAALLHICGGGGPSAPCMRRRQLPHRAQDAACRRPTTGAAARRAAVAPGRR